MKLLVCTVSLFLFASCSHMAKKSCCDSKKTCVGKSCELKKKAKKSCCKKAKKACCTAKDSKCKDGSCAIKKKH